jgi:hypothetical protein
MNPLSVDVKDMLVAESGLDLTFGTNLFISREPPSPDNCVTLYDTPGAIPDLGLQGETYYRDSFQVRVRNNSYIAGMSQIYSIKDVLHTRANETWNATFYALFRLYMSPFVL